MSNLFSEYTRPLGNKLTLYPAGEGKKTEFSQTITDIAI